jgi:hypothetical protein
MFEPGLYLPKMEALHVALAVGFVPTGVGTTWTHITCYHMSFSKLFSMESLQKCPC